MLQGCIIREDREVFARPGRSRKNCVGDVYGALSKSIFVIAFAILVFGCRSTQMGTVEEKVAPMSKKPLIIGHRGAAGLAPENTLAAFTRALELGVDGIEMDVMLSADREVVVHHDFRLKPEITRTTEGVWLGKRQRTALKDITLAELKTYDVGRLKPGTVYSNRYPMQQPVDGERIPTLGEVISLLKKRDDERTQLWIEIKTSPEEPEFSESPEAVVDAVLRVLREEAIAHRTLILSFDWRSLAYVQRIAPDIPTIYVSHIGSRLNNVKPGKPGPSPWTSGIDVDDFGGSIPRAVKAANGRYWAPYYGYLTPNLLEEAHYLGLRVAVWTPDSKRDMEHLMEMGLDVIITNRPDVLMSMVK
jgi:glycerophosphoryl diester phosphodiesterase